MPTRKLLNAHALTLALCGALLASPAWAERTPAPEGAKVYIISPKDGETVPQTFKVQFGLSGMGVAPAGADLPKTGHHHLLIDVAELPPLDRPLGPEIKHFGGGQTETEITLEPGEHTLQLMLGDKSHIPFDPPIISEKITIKVQ
jgi:hypothetical protein